MNILNFGELIPIYELNKQNRENLDFVYKSKDLVVLAPHNHKIAGKYSTKTSWCSQTKSGFCMHSVDEVLFRFLFKDGYKLRLNMRRDGLVGSWGGPKDEKMSYPMVTFKRDPQKFGAEYPSESPTQKMIDRIKSIPKEVIDLFIEYTNKKLKERSPSVSEDFINNFMSEIKEIIQKYISNPKNKKKLNNTRIELYDKKGYNENFKKVIYTISFDFTCINEETRFFLNKSYDFYILDKETLFYNNKKVDISKINLIFSQMVDTFDKEKSKERNTDNEEV